MLKTALYLVVIGWAGHEYQLHGWLGIFWTGIALMILALVALFAVGVVKALARNGAEDETE